MRVVVVGAAVGGTAAAMAFADRGHDVVVVERDAHPMPESSFEAYDGWTRPGVPHFRLPHACLALGRRVLRNTFPEVIDDLSAAGSFDIDLTASAPPGVAPHEDLAAIGCRRPVIEWAMRRALGRRTSVRVATGVRVEALVASGSPPRVSGVRTSDGGTIEADLVVDATGRSSRLPAWLDAIGAGPPGETSAPCHIVYYCRYYRFRDGGALPTRTSPFGPRSDLGYMSFGTFPADDGTWALVLNCPTAREFHALRDEATYEEVARSISQVAPLVAPGVSTPITPVLPMGELRNLRRSLVVDGAPVALGVQPIGDALLNTDPIFAWGLSLALTNAVELAAVVEERGRDAEAVALAFDDRVSKRSESCYRWSRDCDDSQRRAWSGEAIDASSPDGDLPRFLTTTLMFAALRDPEIYTRAYRRTQLLDPLDELPADRPLLERAAQIATAARQARPPTPQGPSREEMLELLA